MNSSPEPTHPKSLSRWIGTAAILLVLIGTGCKVGPDYTPPETTTPSAWSGEAEASFQSTSTALASWWSTLNDPLLAELIRKASNDNLSLQIAAARIEEALALRGVAKSGLAPQVDAVGAAQYTRSSEATTFLPPGASRENGYFSIGASAAWEIDLWGRVQRSIESATASLEATEEDYRDTLVILYAQVAAAYVEARTLQQRILFAEENAEAQRDTLKLTQDLNSAGLVGDLDVSQATLNLARTESIIPSFRAALTATINELAVLLGDAPGTQQYLFREIGAIPTPPDIVNVGLPADLLRQRPDIRRAERLLAAQTALIGVATAELYPQFSLPGTLSLEAFDINNLNGSSLAYAFGPTVRWNLFSGGRIRSQIRAEEARTKQALHAYEQTVLIALAEVENTMAALARERDRIESVRRARDSAKKSVDLVKDLYRNGLTHFQNVLDMERSLATEEDNLATSRGALTQNLVALYRSLGGGWQMPPSTEDTTESAAVESSAPQPSADETSTVLARNL